MTKRPNVLWLMSDQHNANSTGYAGNPNVKTPNLDRLAAAGVNFRRAYTANPICAPARISLITGQYCHTHRMFGNVNNLYSVPNPDTLAAVFRRSGYQTALFGKAHMVPLWDREGFEHIRYDNLGDVAPDDPLTSEYFRSIVDADAADRMDREMNTPGAPGSRPSFLPYELSCEHFTGEEAVRFLGSRDRDRPFFAQVSFQRPHGCDYPSAEYFEMYDPADMVLPGSAADLFENRFASKPEPIRDLAVKGSGYPLASPDRELLKQCLARYYGLISMIDNEIGRVIEAVREAGDLDNTIILYTADHGDFAGEHGLFLKGLSLYESIHRVPFLLVWPGGPQGAACDGIIETVDWYPTVCRLCGIEAPAGRDGRDILPVALGEQPGKQAAFCEYMLDRKLCAIRTQDYRLVINADAGYGELYDTRSDPGEILNLYDAPGMARVRAELTEQLLLFTMDYSAATSFGTDAVAAETLTATPAWQLHWGTLPWSDYARRATTQSARKYDTPHIEH